MGVSGDLDTIKREVESLRAEVEVLKQQLSLLLRERITPERLTRLIGKAVKRPN